MQCCVTSQKSKDTVLALLITVSAIELKYQVRQEEVDKWIVRRL